MARHISGARGRKAECPKLDEITGALAERCEHHCHANMGARLQCASERKEARRSKQITADFVERENDEIGAWQVQKRESAVKQASSQLHADHQCNGDQTESRAPQRGAIKRIRSEERRVGKEGRYRWWACH